jgi:hypothetical protein
MKSAWTNSKNISGAGQGSVERSRTGYNNDSYFKNLSATVY